MLPVEPKPDFPALERALLDRWDADHAFERSVDERPADNVWSFYDGPPFATGLPHYGHLLAGTMKDAIPRFWTMRGKRVVRRWGWDCHGLPVEFEVEKQLKLSGKRDIDAMGIGAFNEACRGQVLKYTKEWEQTVRRMGRWVDMTKPYRTMDPDYMESIWWVLQQLWTKGLLAKGHRAMHICPRCSTPLSNFEVSQNYKDIQDISITPRFRDTANEHRYFLAWTTTPWTLPGNVLLAINPNTTYAEVEHEGDLYVLAWDRVPVVFKDLEHRVVREVSAKELIGQEYEPLFPYYADTEGAFRVVADSFVTLDEGTGIVHIAPAFGEEDYLLGQREGVGFVQHVTMQGTFADAVVDFAGKDAKGTDKEIVRHLKDAGSVFTTQTIQHSYPHCWRCDTPLLNYAMEAWFVKVERMREKLLHTNEEIRWVPEHLKHGRFGKWLEQARDWNISRNRYWGTPLPIWVGESGKTLVIGSREELMQHSKGAVTKDGGRYIVAASGEELDLHKHIVDEIPLYDPESGEELHRIPEVLDCWFESGSMPYAQAHYPFENKELVEATYPADFIAEGLDQTRGWFYTLHVLANALELPGKPSPAFKNVLVNGIILAADGQKMSKSKKNYPDPNELIERYGADAIRFTLLASPAVRAEDLRFSDQLVAEVVKGVHLPVWNTLSFLGTYTEAAGVTPGALPTSLTHELDQWIVARVELLTQEVTDAYEAYDLQGTVKPLLPFLDALTNWYVRRSRSRFNPANPNTDDRAQAFATLAYVLKRVALLLAPAAPFLAELVWERLGETGSIHLAPWPTVEAVRCDTQLCERIEEVRAIVRLGHAVRSKAKLAVRQPLSAARVGLPTRVAGLGIEQLEEVIAEELNVLDLRFEAPDEIATQTVTPNPRVLGKRLGGKVQEVLAAAKAGQFTLRDDGSVELAGEVLAPEEVTVGYRGNEGEAVESAHGTVVALDTTITPELERMGLVRAATRAINQARKDAGATAGATVAKVALGAVFADLNNAETLASLTAVACTKELVVDAGQEDAARVTL